VYGTAGSGKTQIARHFFDDALRRGRRPLLVCFNRPLSERLKVAVQPGGHVVTFNGLCAEFLEERGQQLHFDEMKQDPRFWEKVSERVVGEAVPDHWKFGTLIVDEGQDFEPIWADILGLFLEESQDWLWLEDPDQNLRDQRAVVLPGFVGYRARANYRSPQSIAQFIRRTLPFEFEAVNELPGLGVGVTWYDAPGDQPRLVGKVIGELLRRGFSQSQIVILTTHHVVTPGASRSALGGPQRVGNYRLRRFTGEYDLLGNQITTAGQITFDSITRFKGQESPAVILVDVDPDPKDQDRADRLLFAGMSRATVRLELVVRAGNPLNRRFTRP
jgi:UvrD-like helicase family protein